MILYDVPNDVHEGSAIHKLIDENDIMHAKLSTLRRLFASLVIGIVSGEEEAMHEDIDLIEEVLTSD